MVSAHLRLNSFDSGKNQLVLIQSYRLIRCSVPADFINQLELEGRRKGTLIYLGDVREHDADNWSAERAAISNRENFTVKITDGGLRDGKGHVFAGKPVKPETDRADPSYGFSNGDIVSIKLQGKLGMGLSELFRNSSHTKAHTLILDVANLQEVRNFFFEQTGPK